MTWLATLTLLVALVQGLVIYQAWRMAHQLRAPRDTGMPNGVLKRNPEVQPLFFGPPRPQDEVTIEVAKKMLDRQKREIVRWQAQVDQVQARNRDLRRGLEGLLGLTNGFRQNETRQFAQALLQVRD